MLLQDASRKRAIHRLALRFPHQLSVLRAQVRGRWVGEPSVTRTCNRTSCEYGSLVPVVQHRQPHQQLHMKALLTVNVAQPRALNARVESKR